MCKLGSGFGLAFVCAVVSITPIASAARLGHPSYSASAATAAQRQWNIVADPGYATDGSTTTLYAGGIASLHEVDADGNFYLIKILVDDLSVTGHVVEKDFSGAVKSYTFAPGELSHEIGAVQVFWSLVPASSAGVMPAMPPLPNDITSLNLSEDEDTHNLIFNNISGITQSINFENYQNPGSASLDVPNYFHAADFYEGYFQENSSTPLAPFMAGGPTDPEGITAADTGNVSDAPEPAGLLGLGMVGLLLGRRNRLKPASRNA